MKTFYTVLIGLCVFIIIAFTWRFKVVAHSDSLSKSGRQLVLANFVLPHFPRPTFLETGGKTFRYVKGLPPHYLNVFGANKIVFVTAVPKEIPTIHVYDNKRDQFWKFEHENSLFGRTIGTKQVKSLVKETAEIVDDRFIILIYSSPSVTNKLTLDLKKETILSDLFFENSTNRHL